LTPRITVGLPVYRGGNLIGKALDCLQRQTFSDFEAIISVDGGDLETAAACRPFLVDPRFRMIVHPERLDWVGNFNWLLQQDLREFFCYRQHDDTTAPEFFEALLRAADRDPNAAAVYCDCQYTGGRNDIDIAHSIEAEVLERMLLYIEGITAVPLRGLIRRPAIRQAGLVKSDEFRAPLQVFVWLAKLLRWGNFRRIAKPLYYKLDRPNNFTNEYFSSPEDWKRAVQTTLFTGLLEVALSLCRTPEQRLFFQQTIVDKIVLQPTNNEPNSSGKLLSECLDRLRHEGHVNLLTAEELPQVLQEVQRGRYGLKLLKQYKFGRIIHRIRHRQRLAKMIYPESRTRRVRYQIQRLLKVLKRQCLADHLR
jgi:glycosyltransferase involved in cell wall biosynthesis